MDSLRKIQNIIDDNKENMTENSYLQLCNASKTIFESKESYSIICELMYIKTSIKPICISNNFTSKSRIKNMIVKISDYEAKCMEEEINDKGYSDYRIEQIERLPVNITCHEEHEEGGCVNTVGIVEIQTPCVTVLKIERIN